MQHHVFRETTTVLRNLLGWKGTTPLRRLNAMDFLRLEEGSALVEFSLFLPTLMLMLIGVVDLGLATEQEMVISEAAHEGAMYATLPGNDPSNATVQTAMKKAATDAAGSLNLPSTSVTANASYVCSSTGMATTSPPASCSGTVLEYAQVTIAANLPAMMGYPGLPTNFKLGGSSTIRVQ